MPNEGNCPIRPTSGKDSAAALGPEGVGQQLPNVGFQRPW